jgi:monovalent cation/hydrogen antiporter
MAEVEFILALLVAIAVLVALADRISLPYPIVLVLGGAALGLVPGMPEIQLPPDIVFLLFIPPLVFVAAFFTSWRDFAANLRPILSLAVGLVLATAVGVAVAAHGLAGMAWAPAFVLGAVVANTDTTAIVAISDQTPLPRRAQTILEGESLVNDAVALTAFRLAIVATVTGSFAPWSVGASFGVAVVGAVVIGLAVGWLTAAARARTHDARIVIIIGLLTPYAAYLLAERIGASGILAIVIAGLYVGRREARIEDAVTRLQARSFWNMVIFLIDGLLFILVGVQLRPIWNALSHDYPGQRIGVALAIALVVVAARAVWVVVSTVLSRGVGALAQGGWREVAIVGWAGLRGGDTLAAALSVPLATAAGRAFPSRPEIVFFAFAVIVVTLVGQGLSLPWLVDRLGVAGEGGEKREERLARRAAAEAALDRLDAIERQDGAPADLVAELRARYQHQASLLATGDGEFDGETRQHVARHQTLRRDVVAAERAAILRLRDEGAISDQVLRRVERDLDLEEARLEL